MKAFDALEDSDDDFKKYALARFSFLNGLWTSGAEKAEQFQEAEQQQHIMKYFQIEKFYYLD